MKKLAYLDGLRGIAALIVVFHHLVLLFYPVLNNGEETNSIAKYISISPLNIFYNGDYAVCLFFILSGYVLSYKYISSNNPKILIGYAIKRYFRLLPLIAASVIFCYAAIKLNLINTNSLNLHTGSGNWLTDLFKTDTSFMALIENIFYGILFFGDNQYNPVVWSMKVEFIGSMLLFAFLILNHKIKPKWILFMIAFAAAFYFKQYYYIAFLLGYGLCFLHRNNMFYINSIIIRSILFIIAIFLCSFPAAWQYWNSSIYGIITFKGIDLFSFYHVIGSGILLLLIIQHKPFIDMLSSKVILFIGKISFPLYLFHLIILVLIANPLFLMFLPALGYNFAFIVSVTITFPIIIIVSYLANKFIDQPALSLANKIERQSLKGLFK
ncbi:MAG: acyltransferase [Bacteroidetes bacterium]|nr:acyltransferase [Bacteroidota bacterium]